MRVRPRRFSDREVYDGGEDRGEEDDARQKGTKAQPALGGCETEPVSDVGPEGSGEDIGDPEGEDGVRAETPESGDDTDEDQGQQDRKAGSPSGEFKSPVAQSRAESEGHQNGEPVERFAGPGGDAVDGEGSFFKEPDRKNNGEPCREHAGADPERYAGLVNEEVGVERSGDAHHDDREPVRAGEVVPETHLNAEHNGSDHGEDDCR